MELTTFIHGSAHDLHQLADGSVQMIATSPPYYGLRAYAGEQGVEWPEVTFRLNEWVEPTTVPPMRCGLGMEPSPVAFIGHLILCLREWRGVLRDDGVCFVNLGDSYASNQKGSGGPSEKQLSNTGSRYSPIKFQHGVKEKDLLGIPWLFAIAARADGWFLRSDIIWAKPNPMPESVTDRCTKSHEYVFLLSKSQRYFWDAEGVKETSVDPEGSAKRYEAPFNVGTKEVHNGRPNGAANTTGMKEFAGTRNLRTVWTIATQPTPFAHFATFPEKLVEPMIRAGSSERGACPHCGKAWVRCVEKGYTSTGDQVDGRPGIYTMGSGRNDKGGVRTLSGQEFNRQKAAHPDVTIGFAPACTCPALEPVPCVVLEPFKGSGTTGKVAVRLGRAYVGVDIAQEYLDGVTSERFGAGVQIGMGL